MISNNDLLQIKERLLVSASAARRMVESNEPTIRYDEQEYWRVHIAFSAMQSDVTAVLTELDTLRAMFLDRVNEFLAGGGLNNAVSSSPGNQQDAGEVVAGVPTGVGGDSGPSPQPDSPAVSGPVPAKRPYRRRKPRAEPAGDTASLPGTPEEMDGRAG